MTKRQMTAATESVELPSRIVSRVESRLPHSEFDSTDQYITFVLEEVLARVEDSTAEEDFEAVDEDEVQDRLKSLGYLSE
ncbi:hypothetical protein [Halegenticoccus tardaugens]|uniref:hypothetical protein n=1 Tax=Halegenticoccus tardaugens TaxID=2071624 RepID=UPI001E3622D0|nr:hypothetical protein [Halegenticoccus tardaugens]